MNEWMGFLVIGKQTSSGSKNKSSYRLIAQWGWNRMQAF